MLRTVLNLPFALALCALAPLSITAVTLRQGTTVEVRLSVATGSRISHPGDQVEGTVIAPVFVGQRILIPQGAMVFGSVTSVERLGLGLKHLTAAIKYCFNTLRLPDGETFPIATRLIEVETAKERVNADGNVRGIHPTANLSSGISFYVFPFLYVAPAVVGPALGIKFLIARSPDPEILFPAGTEVILQLTAAVNIPRPNDGPPHLQLIAAGEIANARCSLGSSPQSPAAKESGRASDLVNIMFIGHRDQIDRAFHAAGWSGAQRGSAMSLYRMYHSLVERIGYSMAPMGNLTLNGKSADAAYEKSLDTFSKRHHLRLWKQPDSDLWLSAATEDVGYKFRGMHLTHATDPRIDNERAKVVNDLNFTGCLDAATLLGPASLHTTDQTRGAVVTDGDIAVLRLNDCRHPNTMPAANLGPRGHCRFVRGLLALRNDLVRSNLIFLGYNTVKLVSARQRFEMSGYKPDLYSNQMQYDGRPRAKAIWARDSVLYTTSNVR